MVSLQTHDLDGTPSLYVTISPSTGLRDESLDVPPGRPLGLPKFPPSSSPSFSGLPSPNRNTLDMSSVYPDLTLYLHPSVSCTLPSLSPCRSKPLLSLLIFLPLFSSLLRVSSIFIDKLGDSEKLHSETESKTVTEDWMSDRRMLEGSIVRGLPRNIVGLY